MAQPRKHEDAAARQRAYRERQAAARRLELTTKGLPPAPAISTMPSRERWRGLVEQARLALETTREEMQSYWDERSETWQEGERGAELAERIDALDRALAELPV